MQYEYLKLDVPAANGAGAAKSIERHRVKSVYVGGTFNATVTIQISPDKTLPLDSAGWFTAGTPVAGAILTFEHACTWIRVLVSSYVSGLPEVKFGGYDVV